MLPSKMRAMAARITSYPRYTGAAYASAPLATRKALANIRAPDHSRAPPHPPRPPVPPPPSGFTRTLHAAPAAYPREFAESTGSLERSSHPFRSSAPPATESKEERNARIASEKDVCVGRRLGANPRQSASSSEPAQWVVAERWRRDVPSRDGVTLVLTHACGLDKSHWDPVVRSLLARDPKAPGGQYGSGDALSKPTNVVINDVWLLDDVQHGASVDVNAGRLGTSYSWVDIGRDIINLVENVLPSVKDDPQAPWQLQWEEAGKGTPPKVILVGHSYGGSGVVHAAHARPDLFHSVFLAEPMVTPSLVNDPKKGYPLTMGALKRRSEWPSREAASAANRSNPMFKTWNEDTFKLWLDHSLVPVDPAKPDGAVTLATPTWAEASTFSEPYGPPAGWSKLPELQVPTGFFMAGDPVWMGGENVANEMVWRPPRARNERLMDSSHLMVQEKPTETADAIWRFLTTLDAGEWDQPRRD